MNNYKNIITQICAEQGIKLTFKEDGWLIILEKSGKTKCIVGYKFPLNYQSTAQIMDDKGLFYDLMQYKNLPIIKHFVIDKNTKEELINNFFKQEKERIVVKGNIGTCGKEVFLVDNISDLKKTINNLLTKQDTLSLCPYYEIINEYRVIVLNGKEKLIYGKKRPIVIGDGHSDLLTLAKIFNEKYYNDEEKQHFIKNYIPAKGEEVMLSFKFNLSMGSVPYLDIDSQIKNNILTIVHKIIRELDIVFASIDIIETTNHQLFIMEANSGIMMNNFIKQIANGYDIAYEIYNEAIKTMFA